jgi:hypothetical protein
MEDVGIFYEHLVHFTVFCYILWTFGIVHGNLVYFSPFWYFIPRKIWQPWGRLTGPTGDGGWNFFIKNFYGSSFYNYRRTKSEK